MPKSSKIALIKEILESAEASIRSAKQMLSEMAGDSANTQLAKTAEKAGSHKISGDTHIIEGAFDGQNMMGPDGRVYSVPANYASKSKLIPGDILKLTITEDGTFLYKQIGPVERKKIVGTLTYDEGQYRVIASAKSYKVLLASVTYFKGEIGDKITIIVPESGDSDWAAIENVLPRFETDIEPEDFKI